MRTINDRFEQYNNALNKLESAIDIYNLEKKEIIIDALIQRFEFCIELSWKLLKEYLEYEKLGEFSSPRSVIKESYKQKLIDDGELWLDALEDRNLTSHTYDELTANRIKDNIINKYFKLFVNLKEKFEELL